MAFRVASTLVATSSVTLNALQVTIPTGTIASDTVLLASGWGDGTIKTITPASSGVTFVPLIAPTLATNMGWALWKATGLVAGNVVILTYSASAGRAAQAFVFTSDIGAVGTTFARPGSTSTVLPPGRNIAAGEKMLVFATERTTATPTTISSSTVATGEAVTQLAYAESVGLGDVSFYLGEFTATGVTTGTATVTYSGGSTNGAGVQIVEVAGTETPLLAFTFGNQNGVFTATKAVSVEITFGNQDGLFTVGGGFFVDAAFGELEGDQFVVEIAVVSTVTLGGQSGQFTVSARVGPVFSGSGSAYILVDIPGAAFSDDVAIGEVASYSMSEAAIPTRVGDSDGAISQLNVAGVAGRNYQYANEQRLVLTTSDGAQVVGTVTNTRYGVASGIVEYTVDPALSKLNIDVQMFPRWQTYPSSIFGLFMSMAGVTNYSWDSDLEDTPNCFVPGFVGNLWDNLKQWCAAFGFEVFMDGEMAYLTKVGRYRLELMAEPDSGVEEIDTSDHAASIDITDYNYVGVFDGRLWKADTVYSVGAGEAQEQRVSIEGTPQYVIQPSPVTSMIFTGNGQGSFYVVTGSDGYIVSPAFWTDNDGSIEVAISPDAADELIITIHGATDTSRAPYRISEGAADRPALWIGGNGLLRTPKITNFPTGDSTTSNAEPVNIDNSYIGNAQMMSDAAIDICGRYSGPVHRLSIPGVPDFQVVKEASTRWSPPYSIYNSKTRFSNEQASLGKVSGVAYGWANGVTGDRPEVLTTGGVRVTGVTSAVAASRTVLLRSMELSDTEMNDYATWSKDMAGSAWIVKPASAAGTSYTLTMTVVRNSGTAQAGLQVRTLRYSGGYAVNGIPSGGTYTLWSRVTNGPYTFVNGVPQTVSLTLTLDQNVDFVVLELFSDNIAAAFDYTVTAVQFVSGTSATLLPPVVTSESVLQHFYGRVSGTMLKYGTNRYRVVSAAYNAESVDLQLQDYATIADFNNAWGDATIADFNNGMPNLTSLQHSSAPLALIE